MLVRLFPVQSRGLLNCWRETNGVACYRHPSSPSLKVFTQKPVFALLSASFLQPQLTDPQLEALSLHPNFRSPVHTQAVTLPSVWRLNAGSFQQDELLTLWVLRCEFKTKQQSINKLKRLAVVRASHINLAAHNLKLSHEVL